MIFSSLRTASFRNLANAEIFTGAKDVFLVGENGQGKTNFLEALYFCAYASSFRAVRDSELACSELTPHGYFSLNAEKDFSADVKIVQEKRLVSGFSAGNGEALIYDEVLVKFEKGKKSVIINGKRAEDRKELLSIAPSIVFCHEDMEFVSGSPERRRWFFDQTLSLYDIVYLDGLRHYRRVLKSRNTVLKEIAAKKFTGSPESVLDALDIQLAQSGLELMEKREKAVREFSGLLSPLYEEVCGISGVTVQYNQSWNSPDGGHSCDDITGRLRQRRAADIAAGISLSGPHRDRYVFTRNDREFTGKASTGQRRLLALLLRTAQARCFSKETGQNPVLLLDDVLLEMDGEKRRRFLSVLPAYDQAFYTFLPEEPYQRYQKEDTLVYRIKNGQAVSEPC
ncbi:MAG: DNA replication/repair protein RecF [Treponema sp.]|jgi:DNA replication and repair protein RecF|nr:DNA replication/repair protein RecF [Treponema sp.]